MTNDKEMNIQNNKKHTLEYIEHNTPQQIHQESK